MPKRKNVPTYTDTELKKALDAVKSGVPVRTAAKQYNIPKTTLLYKKRGTLAPTVKRRGCECILGEDNEKLLLQWIFHMSENGFPISRDQLLDSVQLLLNTMKKTTVFKDNRPGRHWYDAFRARHDQLSERMSENLTHNRGSVTEAKLRVWFQKVGEYLQTKSLMNIDASRIFNCNETAFFLSPKGSKVLIHKGDKTVYNFINNDENECLTTFFCGNAEGQMAPPTIIFSYKRIPSRIAESAPHDWGIGHSESGWMTGETFYDYIVNVFYPWLVKNNFEFPVALYLDGHSSHVTMALTEFCKEKRIELIALYPNSTHILQPMNEVFHSLKTAWTNCVRQWRMENEGRRMKRENFARILQEALNTLDLKIILQNGFRTTGLYPFSANAINYKKYFKKSVDTGRIALSTSEDRTKIKAHLSFLENHIDNELLKNFYDAGGSQEWNGAAKDESLYHLWRGIKNEVDSNNVGQQIFTENIVDEKHINSETGVMEF